MDPPIQNIGDIQEVTQDGKVKKEILELGEGVKKPKLNHLATVVYKAYFFDHTEFDSSHESPVVLSLGDIAWPEGFWKGLQEMRKGELAKIKIKKKYGFGRKLNTEALKFPVGYEEIDSEKRKRLMTKGIIYEVRLVDWVERVDIEGDGVFLKTYLVKPVLKEWEKPTEMDECVINVKAFYSTDDVFYTKENWSTYPSDEALPESFRKILESLKRTEHSTVLVKGAFITEEDA